MSNENKYDAPWTVGAKTSVNTDGVRSNSGDVIGTFWKDERHIAALIAAAPEMLEWLEWLNVAIIPLVDNCYKRGEFRNCEVCRLEPCNFKKIEMLIAKAKGETNGDA